MLSTRAQDWLSWLILKQLCTCHGRNSGRCCSSAWCLCLESDRSLAASRLSTHRSLIIGHTCENINGASQLALQSVASSLDFQWLATVAFITSRYSIGTQHHGRYYLSALLKSSCFLGYTGSIEFSWTFNKWASDSIGLENSTGRQFGSSSHRLLALEFLHTRSRELNTVNTGITFFRCGQISSAGSSVSQL